MHDAGNRRMRGVADGIGAFFRQGVQFFQAGQELARDGIVGIGRIHQRQQKVGDTATA